VSPPKMIAKDKWERAQRLFLSAADLPLYERSRFLDESCAGDAELRAEVESLMRADRNSGEVIASVVEREAALLFEIQVPGDRVGPYRVVHELGRGGMGAVFLAVRDDDQYQKQVAIKVVKRGMDTAEVLERFRHERQILANLDHPYIARLHDGGTTSDGRPFFVMEFVEGLPIDIYCRQNLLTTKDRLRLFLHVCEAVAHAHRNLVVHRDLKPANIFVTAEGTPKLLDFGVAKLLSGTPGANAATTVAMMRLFTPEYASPEQILGLPVTTAADVYSLGAVLYELLTGKRARNVTGATPLEMDRAIAESNVKRPSSLNASLDVDLDNIVLMAMRTEPARRYTSTDQFAEDVRRYLRGEAVIARQHSWGYRTRKFLRRNRWELTASAVVAASLIVATVVSTTQWRRAEIQRQEAIRERSRAEAESARAELARQAEASQRKIADQQRDEAQVQRARAERRVTDLMDLANRTLFDVQNAIENLPGSVGPRKKIVKTTLDYLERLEQEAGEKNASNDDQMRFALSSAYYKIGMVQGDTNAASLMDFDGARKSFHKAEALLAPLHRQQPNEPTIMMHWLEIEDSLADLVYRAGKPEAAAAAFQKLLPIAHRLGQIKSNDIIAAKQEPFIHLRLSNVLHYTDSARGLEHANRQVQLLRDLTVRFPNDAALKQELGVGLAATASAMATAGDLEGAADFYRQSIEIREQLYQSDPHNGLLQRNVSVAYGNYAGVLGVPWAANLGRSEEARAAAMKGVAMARLMIASDPQDMGARVDLAGNLARLGSIGSMDRSHTSEAQAALEEAISMLDPMLKSSPKSFAVASQLSVAREYLGHCFERAGKADQAREQYRTSLAEVEPFLNSSSSAMVQALADLEALALLSSSAGERAAAMDYAKRALTNATQYASEQKSDSRNGQWARAYFTMAAVQAKFDEWQEARQSAERALTLWKPIRNAGVLSVHRKAIDETSALLQRAETLAKK
jgi:serine/threonine protein kinase/tetratricopeptide (TPR) repeat protein